MDALSRAPNVPAKTQDQRAAYGEPQPADWGWLPVVEVPRPADTATHTSDPAPVALIDGVSPTVYPQGWRKL